MKSIKQIALSTAAIAVMVGTASAVEFKVNGDIQFRLREETNIVLDSANNYFPEETKHIYANKYAWNLKLRADVNENLKLKFRISNPNGPGLETVGSNEAVKDNSNVVSIPQAEIQYNIGKFNFSAGILEVKNSSALTLAASAEQGGYAKAINISDTWGVYTNSSQTGLRAGFKFNSTVSVNVVSSIADADYSDVAYTDFRTIIDAPIKVSNNLRLTPSVAIHSGISGQYSNRLYNTNAGLDFKTSITDAISISGGVAYGQFRDTEIADGEGERTGSTNWKAPQGLLISAKPSFKFGIATLTTGYSFATSSDRDATGDADYSKYFQHADVKLALSVADNFTIMPRYRAWYTSDSQSGTNSDLKLRPELLFIAKF